MSITLSSNSGHAVSDFKALAGKWLASTAPSVDSLKAKGVPVKKKGSGVHEVHVQGHWMTPAAAARAGFI